MDNNEKRAKLKIYFWNVEYSTYAALRTRLNGCIIVTVFDTSYKSSKQMHHFMCSEEVLEGLLVHIKLNL